MESAEKIDEPGMAQTFENVGTGMPSYYEDDPMESASSVAGEVRSSGGGGAGSSEGGGAGPSGSGAAAPSLSGGPVLNARREKIKKQAFQESKGKRKSKGKSGGGTSKRAKRGNSKMANMEGSEKKEFAEKEEEGEALKFDKSVTFYNSNFKKQNKRKASGDDQGPDNILGTSNNRPTKRKNVHKEESRNEAIIVPETVKGNNMSQGVKPKEPADVKPCFAGRGNKTGGSNAGGSHAGGSEAVGSDAGGSKAGGSDAGGSKASGTDAVGSKAGGTGAGGSKAGGSDANGSKAQKKDDGSSIVKLLNGMSVKGPNDGNKPAAAGNKFNMQRLVWWTTNNWQDGRVGAVEYNGNDAALVSRGRYVHVAQPLQNSSTGRNISDPSVPVNGPLQPPRDPLSFFRENAAATARNLLSRQAGERRTAYSDSDLEDLECDSNAFDEYLFFRGLNVTAGLSDTSVSTLSSSNANGESSDTSGVQSE